MILQRTLKDSITLTGVGLHSGKAVQLTLKPGRPGQGISFVRTDLPNLLPMAGHYRNITNTQLATTLGRGQGSISTVEHLMSALQGAGIDNASVEVDGPEIPIMDGSAQPFFDAIRTVGVESQRQSRPYLALRRKVEVQVGDKWAMVEPSSKFEVHGSIDWAHPSIGYQEFHYIEGHTSFSEISRARTFGFLRDVEALKRMGLARGGSLDNAVVLDESGVLNPEGLRYANEFARHKVLDALGDFKLSGVAIRGYFRLHRAGHDLHSQLLGAIFRDPDNFEIIDSGMYIPRRAPGIRAALAGRLAATVG
ncbi:MAG: UDP-3-O-acyl-N-acetylglucosamine deacetylase [Oligoflexia bacterium]|nr:UDP-3-O-acyl-N-acetylglucosamine deacetylase [Oligoflexia bacterium]